MGVHVNNLVCRTGLKKGRRETPCEFGVKSQESLELLGKLPHEAAARSTVAKKQIANQIPKYNHEKAGISPLVSHLYQSSAKKYISDIQSVSDK